MDISLPLDPKAFPSYDDYRNALKFQEKFAERCDAVGDVMRTAKTQEQEREKMKEMGFTYVEDETCGRAWCEEKEECLWIAVGSHQDLCNDTVFDHLLAREDLLLSNEAIDRCLQQGCDALPRSWHDRESKEHRALTWFISVSNTILLEMERDVSLDVFIAERPDLQEFYRQSYLCTLHLVHSRPWRNSKEGKHIIASFLKETDRLPRKRAGELLEDFLRLI